MHEDGEHMLCSVEDGAGALRDGGGVRPVRGLVSQR